MDLRAAFIGEPKEIASPLGPLLLGIVDASIPGVAAGISRLLFRSIGDARARHGGHLPEWLVDDIERNYISPEKVASLWAPFGHRFAVLYENEIVGTVHITKSHDTIFTIDRVRLNVSARDYPDFKPDRHHHLVNLSVKHELRRARLATLMLDGILTHFRDRFDGDGLWVRGDPPWHVGLVGLDFVHDPSMDVFLPKAVERTRGLSHEAFNLLFACDCRPERPAKPDILALRDSAMKEKKLQYVSFTRAFERARPTVRRRPTASIEDLLERDASVREIYATDYGLTRHALPSAIARPREVHEVAAVLAWASSNRVPVAVRGRGQSADGQSLTVPRERKADVPSRLDDSNSEDELRAGIVLSTERLERVVAIEEGDAPRVVVEGGLPWWQLVSMLAGRGLFPPVLTGWLGATVGGTLATGGFSKGSLTHGFQTDQVEKLVVVTGDGRIVECTSTQAGWLFESALGGLGAFGVIVEATVPLVRLPPYVEVRREVVAANALRPAIERAIAEGAWHVTSFARDDGFTVVSAGLRAAPSKTTIDLLLYLEPTATSNPRTPTRFFHMFVPRAALDEMLDACRATLELDAGDALQVIPLRGAAASKRRLHQCAAGDVVYAICVTREVRTRDAATIEAEGRALLSKAIAKNGKSYVAGALPRDVEEWRGHLGDEVSAAVQLRKRLADPAGILAPRIFVGEPKQ